LIESLAIIAGHHGLGRSESAGQCIEAPAAAVLHAALAALDSVVLPLDVLRAKRRRASAYADIIASGSWCTPERDAMDALNSRMEAEVTGSVRITLFKGTLQTSEVAALDGAAVPRT